MKKSSRIWATLVAVATVVGIGQIGGTQAGPRPAVAAEADRIERGRYLVTVMDCNGCHTPWQMGPQGPAPDMTRMLSGHPADFAVGAAPELGAGPWMWAGAATNTAFAGPWGVSFAANLTPDAETGLGRWTEKTFRQALRTGRHEGLGRPILPPMPSPAYAQATDEDLGAIFAFLQSVPAVKNRVPQPLEPAGIQP